MIDYVHSIRETALKSTEGQPVQQRADALNLIEAIISEEFTPEQIVERIMEGTLPETYKPLSSITSGQTEEVGEKV